MPVLRPDDWAHLLTVSGSACWPGHIVVGFNVDCGAHEVGVYCGEVEERDV